MQLENYTLLLGIELIKMKIMSLIGIYIRTQWTVRSIVVFFGHIDNNA